LDGSAGLRMTAGARAALLLGEGAEARVGEARGGAVLALGLHEVIAELAEHAVDDLSDGLLGDAVGSAVLAIDPVDQLLLGHTIDSFRPFRRTFPVESASHSRSAGSTCQGRVASS